MEMEMETLNNTEDSITKQWTFTLKVNPTKKWNNTQATAAERMKNDNTFSLTVFLFCARYLCNVFIVLNNNEI